MPQVVIDVTVVGAGPAGLATIASLLEKAQKAPAVELRIDVIEKRKEFTRRQKLIVPKTDILPDPELRWDEFCHRLFDPHNELRINHHGELIDTHQNPINNLNKRQKFLRKLMRQKDNYPAPKNFSIKALQEVLKEHIDHQTIPNVKLQWHETRVITIDLQKKVLHLENEKSVTFDYLLICEGEKRELVQELNNIISKDFTSSLTPFHYKKMGTPTHHIAARLTVKPLSKEKTYQEFLAKNRKPIQLSAKELHSYGWDPLWGNPDCIFDDNLYKENLQDPNWKPRLFIASRIPELLHTNSNPVIKRRKALEWASFFAAKRVQVSADNFIIDEKGENDKQSNINTFLSDMRYVDKPCRKLPNGGYIVLLGDCAMSPYYPVGISSAIPMVLGGLVADTIVNYSQQKEPFQVFIDKYHHYEKIIADYTGYRNEDIETAVECIQELETSLRKELADLPVSSSQEIQTFIEKQNRTNVLRKLSQDLMAESTGTNTFLTVKGCLEKLSLSDLNYFEAITFEPRIKELVETLQDKQLLTEMIKNYNASQAKVSMNF
ncbi:hypothetical protein A8135_05670 [Legionella jamestowniensis]|uniref:Uncharacterized protein n=1 Tax=Legionella jamestowniensis TaxID=455 RepID=A0ABX2XR69_9GAMM|nr:hypothetical protein [Legionella jamestowniensis]OCH97117.1 hypothetical protein A8135_05670 [Legionella jamestowniensis]